MEHPYRSVQMQIGRNPEGRRIVGCAFRLKAHPSHFLTAAHCVADLEPPDLEVMDPVRDDEDIACAEIVIHPEADLAMLRCDHPFPEFFEACEFYPEDYKLGTQVHCFGYCSDLQTERPERGARHRVVGGIVQRDLIWDNRNYSSRALELSMTVPRGMSGAPVFVLERPGPVLGVALGTLESEIVAYQSEEFTDGHVVSRERVSRIVQYGVALRLHPYRNWISDVCAGGVAAGTDARSR